MNPIETEVEIDYDAALKDVASYFERLRERARPRTQTLDLPADRRPVWDDLRYPIPSLDPTWR